MSELFGDDVSPVPSGQPYRVLARKYRPATLAELIGQEAMVRTLTNAFLSGRLPQAWILTGVRGIGKTTTARIIAKALNCSGRDPKDKGIEPCGVCDSCRAIAEDRHVDVQEMDAASRTGVDDIREIIEGVRYGPVSAQYKVYILDEVHMLSKNAFNALLKTLEEPPPHTKFIFATTEIRKVPVTVLSRCQRFDLRRIDSAMLAAHYARIAEIEGAKAEEEAIKLIAHAADGSVRDGLSLLDQALARGDGAITQADVKNMLGLADRAASLSLCEQLLRGQIAQAMETFDSMLAVGVDPLQALQDLADLLHRLTRAQIASGQNALDSWPEAERKLATALGDVKIPALGRAWQILLKGIGEVVSASNPAQAAEMVLIRLAYAAELPTPGDLIKQIRDQQTSQTQAPQTSSPPSGGNGGGNVLRAGSAARAVASQPLPAAVAQPNAVTASAAPCPSAFRDIVALFATNREGGLYAELVAYVHPVRVTAGKLEVRLDRGASTNLIPRVSQCLNDWTGRRWMVALVDEAGGPTIKEEDAEIERQRQTRAAAHPLMLAVKKAFPEAKLISLKQKEVAAPVATGDDAAESLPDSDETPED